MGPPRLATSEDGSFPSAAVQTDASTIVLTYAIAQTALTTWSLAAYDAGVRNSAGGFLAPGVWNLAVGVPTPVPNVLNFGGWSSDTVWFDITTAATEVLMSDAANYGTLPTFSGGQTIVSAGLTSQVSFEIVLDANLVAAEQIEFLAGARIVTNNTLGEITPILFNVP